MQVKIHVKIIIENTDKQILLMKRSYGSKTRDFPGWWISLPETLDEGIRREIYEETWITHIHNLRVVDAVSSYDIEEEAYVVFVWYMGTTLEHSVHLSDEHDQYVRIERSNIENIWLTPYLLEFLKKTT